ncbi:hypothetical protein [Sinosporangium siamense]|uniref:Uncharacterized protein n=1 Tax=Sinosporangium siamense TaxID=1367973 RepID=A0A919RNL2_9ACTN|nr:hypothetical protein [Sinosporangium siamense]GII97003.1 hypothetical protein Ssi02_72340 [Sinosporangium siamense]
MTTPEAAVQRLREALAALGVATTPAKVKRRRGDTVTLDVAPGLLLWCGSGSFRWVGPGNTWHVQPVEAVAQTAKLLFRHVDGDLVFELRARFPKWTIFRIAGTDRLCAAPATVALSAAPAVNAASAEELSTRLQEIESVHGREAREDPPP